MDRVLIDPLVASAQRVIATMLQMTLETRDETELPLAPAEVCATVHLRGDLVGEVVLEFPRTTAVRYVERLTGRSVEPGSPMVADAVGELANMIVSGLRSMMDIRRVEVGFPVLGSGAGVRDRDAARVVCTSACGDFVLGAVLHGATVGSRAAS